MTFFDDIFNNIIKIVWPPSYQDSFDFSNGTSLNNYFWNINTQPLVLPIEVIGAGILAIMVLKR